MDIENWGKKQQFSIWLVRQVFRVEPRHEMNHKGYLRAVFFVRKKLNTIEVEMGMSFMWRFWSVLENETDEIEMKIILSIWNLVWLIEHSKSMYIF